jgi:hypothetical protein
LALPESGVHCDLSSGVCPHCGRDVDARGITRELVIACPALSGGGYPGCLAVPGDGPGRRLKSLLRKIGFDAEEGCRCDRRALEMDRHGTTWCRANLETIVGWLRDEFERRKTAQSRAARSGWLGRRKFRPWVARLLVRWAIHWAERMKGR